MKELNLYLPRLRPSGVQRNSTSTWESLKELGANLVEFGSDLANQSPCFTGEKTDSICSSFELNASFNFRLNVSELDSARLGYMAMHYHRIYHGFLIASVFFLITGSLCIIFLFVLVGSID